MDGTLADTNGTRRDMTVQMLTTKAEQAILKSFEGNELRLPGNTSIAELRRAAIGAFASKGLPSRRVEEFKYTDLKANLKDAFPLAAGEGAGASTDVIRDALGSHLGPEFASGSVGFIDGHGIAGNEEVRLLSNTLADAPAWVLDALADQAISNSAELLLNTALFTDGVVIDVPEGAVIAQPIVIVSSTQANTMSALRHVIRIGRGAKVTIVEVDRASLTDGPRQSSALTQISIADDAEVIHIKVVEAHKGSMHLGHWQVSLSAHVNYKPFQLVVGEGLVRNGMTVSFNGQFSNFDYGAAAIVHGNGHADSTVVVDHKVAHCTSRELYKTVLDGQARAVFQGKVIVQPGAQKTDGKQMAQALMLSPDAEFDSKPELEIYADDVVCGHGSTAAEIDPDLVFYCTSRGIPLAVARSMLIESFIAEAIDKVEHEGLRNALAGIARDSLAA